MNLFDLIVARDSDASLQLIMPPGSVPSGAPDVRNDPSINMISAAPSTEAGSLQLARRIVLASTWSRSLFDRHEEALRHRQSTLLGLDTRREALFNQSDITVDSLPHVLSK